MVWFKNWRKRNRQPEDRASSQSQSQFHRFGDRSYLNEASYFLPKDDTEISRLDFQHFLLRYTLHGNYAAPIQRPTSILDVGSGTGRWALEMAKQFPEANVIGIDLVAPRADEAEIGQHNEDPRPENYVFLQGNVLDGLPFPDGNFDFTHQRLLVAGIPVARWPGVVVELVRVTRPGGWLELVEAIPATGGPAMNQLREWLVGVGLPRGIDIRTTHQIGKYMLAAGVQNIQYREFNVPLGISGRVSIMMTTNYFSLHAGIRELIIAQKTATPEFFDATITEAKREIATGKYVWPYYLAFGQCPPYRGH